MKRRFFLLLLILLAAVLVSGTVYAIDFPSTVAEKNKNRKKTYIKDTTGIPEGEILPQLLPLLYQGGEKFSYDISWSGGIKVGEVTIKINKIDEESDTYELKVRVSSKGGAFSWVYPVDDLHITIVQGPARLPVRHESWQKEGYRYRSHKITTFDQSRGIITYWKNDKPPQYYEIEGKTQNEFSAFAASRLMAFKTGHSFVVPTWADKMRIKVIVEVGRIEKLENTVLGPVDTVQIMPILTFSGTYDQRGDTTIFYTNDQCRVPVKIKSKIILGALTAKLVAWENPACERYPQVNKKYN